MAHTASAKKHIRQDVYKSARNKAIKTLLRHTIRDFRVLAEQKDVSAMEAALPGAYKVLDQAWSKGVYKRNTISRYKSSLARSLAKAKA